MPTRKRPPSALRRLADECADRAAITDALTDLVDDAAGEVLRAVPPATNRVAADRILRLLDALRANVRAHRRAARRLCALVALDVRQ